MFANRELKHPAGKVAAGESMFHLKNNLFLRHEESAVGVRASPTLENLKWFAFPGLNYVNRFFLRYPSYS